MRDRMHPPRMSALSCIVPPTEQLVIRPHIVPLLPTFHGMESENSYAHIKEFEEVCNAFREGGASIDLMRLKLFSFTLNDKAKERYMEAINACPHHGFDTWLLVSYFYDGMSSSMKQLLETMCGGDFMSKNPEEAMDFLSYIAEVSRGWDESNAKEVGRMKSQPNASNAKVGMYTLNEDTDMKEKFATMTRRLEDLEVKKIREVTRERKISFSTSSKSKGIHEVEAQEGESSQVREVKAVITLRSGKEVDLPTSKPEHEPESQAEKEKRERKERKKKGNSAKNEDLKSTMNKELERTINQEDLMKKHTAPPFLQALHGKKGINNVSKILEVLRQVKVNIPLLDMIKQVPTYAKFLKDLCTIKRGLNVSKKAFLTKQVSSIIQCKSPVKYKDPGCPTISVMIGETCVEKALLDLGASVNLPPYSVYKQLGVGELKPTSITLSLANRSMKIPRGMIEDVLVQVDKFYYPVDFVVLDTDPFAREANYVPIILGRPFLATSNAIINCRNGVMQLTFENARRFERESWDLDEGLPKPSDLLATLPPLKMRKEILHLFNGEETQEAVKEEPPKLILRCKKAIGWKISDLKGINPLVCTHHIYMEEEAKPVRQPQKRLNPHMQEVVRAEVLKLLQAVLSTPYHIALRKLNAVTRKDHFPLPFIDQVLERSLAIHSTVFWMATLSIFK
ncbi:hypothetical protein CK203_107276 [Vitis vinifera]|uniref:Retrotransposon gag domain-containing protein n=1 Tax=Vitis vinifera TaxID=29760 RepID=A0A438DLC8_VITVI|nr:hypothetical protein CK203_107276 [Vitis vinifera]